MQSCGLVAEAHAIDEHSEWRTFNDSVSPFKAAYEAAYPRKMQCVCCCQLSCSWRCLLLSSMMCDLHDSEITRLQGEREGIFVFIGIMASNCMGPTGQHSHLCSFAD